MNLRAARERIISELGVTPLGDAAAEAERRVAFLQSQLRSTGARGFVLGISGGVDSATAGRLCQLAVERARAGGDEASFLAVRLPYGRQFDEEDAQRALAFIQPDEVITVDVKPATDGIVSAIAAAEGVTTAPLSDYVRGNVKARQRMVVQYALAGSRGLLVVGTDHAAEAVVGFFTKHGDGACDLVPLAGLTKRGVRAIAAALGAADEIVGKTPTADLESLQPGLPDEEALGLSYDEIDDFLEGRPVAEKVAEELIARYALTGHKRDPAPRP